MSTIANFDINTNFWDANPQFKILGKFAVFYRADTSKGKHVSSKVMWAVALFTDTDKDNKFKNLPKKDKEKIIADEYIRDDKFKWKKYHYLIEYYKETQLTVSKRSLFFFKKKIQEREEFLDKIEYSLENAAELDRIMSNTEKLFGMISGLEAQIEKEDSIESGGIAKGGRKESASERKEL